MEVHAYGQEVAIRIAAGETEQEISVSLQQRHPSQREFSSRSVQWFCSEQGTHYQCGLSDAQLDRVIASQVQAVGHSYGRRTIHGLLSAQGIHASEVRIGSSMGRVAPGPQRGRRQTAHRHLNPPPYTA